MLRNSFRKIAIIFRLAFAFGCGFCVAPMLPPAGGQDTSAIRSHSAPSRVLAESARRVVFDSSAFYGSSIPHWDRGYLVAHNVESFSSESRNVALYDGRGKVREAAIWFPHSIRVVLTSAAVTPEGRIVASGEADNADGTRAPFIARTDLSGKVVDVVQTKGFYPTNVCVAPDNTVWSFGATWWDDVMDRPLPGGVLRHFDFQKGQLAEYIPRSTFPDHSSYGTLSFMRCSSNEVSILNSSEDAYIIMPYEGDAPRLYLASPPPDLRLTGFAVFGPNKAYGAFLNTQKKDDPRQGLYLLKVDDGTRNAHWEPVEAAVGPRTDTHTVVRLWGSDGEYLVFSRAQDSVGIAGLQWAMVSEK